MTKAEFFNILDACDVPLSYVSDYLEKKSSQSPFDLIFVNDGKEIVTRKIDYNLGELLGVVIEQTIFYVKPFITASEIVRTSEVIAFGKKLHPKALPMSLSDMQLLLRNKEAFKNLNSMLKVFGYEPAPDTTAYLILSKDPSATDGSFYNEDGLSDGGSDIGFFIENLGEIFYCANWR